jgi:integrase
MEKTRYPGIYRRGDKYVAVVSYRDGFGRKRQKWITASTPIGARDARRMLLNELERGLRPDGSRMTMTEFGLDMFLPDVASRCRPITVRNYRSLLTNHVLPVLGELKLKDVTRRHLKDLYAALRPATATRVHSVLSAMFTYAVKDEAVLSVNPCATIRRPSYQAPEARHLPPEEAKRLLAAVSGDPLEGAVILGLAGGLRIAEALASWWGDLEDDGTLTVRRSAWGVTKSGRIRSLTLPTGQLTALRRYRLAQAEHLLSVGVRQGPDTPIVADPIGRPVPISTFREAFDSFCGRHGFNITYHSLRHSNAIAMLVGGVDVKTAASRLGHSNPSQLIKTYSHFIRSADKAAADKLEAMLGG